MLYGILAILMMPNLMVLIGDIILAGTLVYLVRSVNFFRKNIVPNMPAKRSIGLSIRLSGFFAAFFVFNIIFSCVTLLFNPNIMNSIIDNALNMMQSLRANGFTISYAQLHQSLMVVLWIGLIYGLLLLLHLLMSFLFLRRYKYLFEEE